MAMIAFTRLGPRAPAIAIARISGGNARNTSVRRMSASSTRPPAYPATRPTAVPITPASATTTTPMTSEIRAPYRTRLRRSRPSWSVPSQCAAFGGARREARSCASGSYGAMSVARGAPSAKSAMIASARIVSGSRRAGTRTAASAPPRAAAMARSATLDPWVEPVIGDVDDEVGDGIDDRGEQRHAEHRRKVEAYRGCGRVPAEAWPAEDRLGKDGTREKTPERQADDRDRGDEGVTQPMPEHNGALAQALRLGRAHVVLTEHLEHARARHAGDDRRREVAERQRGQHEMDQAAPQRLDVAGDEAVHDVQTSA